MRKTNGLCVMLGTTRTWTARTLDVFLELKPRSTPPAVLSCDSRSRPSCILWEDLFSFFCIPFSRPLLKDKPRPRKGRITDHLYLSASPLLKTTQALFGKKKKILTKLDTEAKKRFAFGKKNGSSRSDGIVEGLFLFRAWFDSQLTSVYMSEEENVEMQTWMYMQDVSYRLPIVLSQFSFPGAL